MRCVNIPAAGNKNMKRKLLTLLCWLLLPNLPVEAQHLKSPKTEVKFTGSDSAVLWQDPKNIRSRDLYYGPGGKAHQPHTKTFTFVDEDLDGSTPKFNVRDETGQKWKIKLGDEARPETAASRLVWAIGYFADEDYFLSELRVKGMPEHVKRGKHLIEPGGVMRNARLKRHPHGKKIGKWKWRDNPFAGTRELNGLRVLMSLMNNWDLKNANTAIYEDGNHREIYLVSDLGASFGAGRWVRQRNRTRSDLQSYSKFKLVKKITPDSVDFNAPARPPLVFGTAFPHYWMWLHERWLGRRIPRSDARWVGGLLAQLTRNQIKQAFRAGGYSAEEIDQFTDVIEERIGELNEL